MDGLRQYVISVIGAALICGILTGLVQNGFAKELMKLLCGVFLAITVLYPVSGMNWDKIANISASYSRDAESIAAMGENMARESMADIIRAESEAYILDKASQLNAELSVEVTLDQENVPTAASLEGEISPYARQKLSDILQTDLGIAKENQLWTG